MTTVLVGGNQFIDCRAVIALAGRPLLDVAAAPLRVTLVVPGTSTREPVRIEDNRVLEGTIVRSVAREHVCVLLVRDVPIVLAALLDDQRVAVRLDLRPVGVDIYDDSNGLHVGTNVLRGNVVVGGSSGVTLG